jgi:excisionase family DNA binding protein
MTITEVAEILGVSSNTIERWEKTRKVKRAKRDYRGYRVYDQNDLEKLVLSFHVVKAFS